MGQCGSAEGERSRNVQDMQDSTSPRVTQMPLFGELVRSLHLRACLAETCVEALSCQSKAPKRGTRFDPSSVRLARKTSLAEFSLPRLRIEAMGTGTSVDAELGYIVFILLHRAISSYIWLYITGICNSYICIYIYIYIYIYATPPLMYPRFVLESCAISETGPNYRVFKRIQGVFN